MLNNKLVKHKSRRRYSLIQIKKIGTLGLVAVGFIAGLAVMYLFLQPKLSYQEKATISYKEQLSSASAALQMLLNAPTPTPAVKYITQPKPAVKCQVMANAYTHFTMCCDADGNCTTSN